MSLFNKKILKNLNILLFLFALLIGLSVYSSKAFTYDNVKLYFNGYSVAYDENLILLVDVPSSGGKATNFFAYEVKGQDDFWIYETRTGTDGALCPELNRMDFIIICVSDSNDNGDYDDFNMIIESYDDGSKTDTTNNYHYGDSGDSDLKIGVYQLVNTASMQFVNDPYVVTSWRSDGEYTYWQYSKSDWSTFYGYMDDYITNGDDWELEDVLNYVNFPAPYYP